MKFDGRGRTRSFTTTNSEGVPEGQSADSTGLLGGLAEHSSPQAATERSNVAATAWVNGRRRYLYRPIVLPSSPDLFWSKVTHEPNTGCWLWMGAIGANGYGLINARGEVQTAHRVAVVLSGRPDPIGLVVDHKCRVTWCVNPDHLEAVPNAENVLRGHYKTSDLVRRDFCPRGHALTADNLMGKKRPRCATCYRAWVAANPEACREKQQRHRAKKKALAAGKGKLRDLVLTPAPAVLR